MANLVSTHLANRRKRCPSHKEATKCFMSKLEAHPLDFILSFLEKWTKDNILQGVGQRGIYIPNRNIHVLPIRASETLRSCRQIRPQRQQNYSAFFCNHACQVTDTS